MTGRWIDYLNYLTLAIVVATLLVSIDQYRKIHAPPIIMHVQGLKDTGSITEIECNHSDCAIYDGDLIVERHFDIMNRKITILPSKCPAP